MMRPKTGGEGLGSSDSSLPDPVKQALEALRTLRYGVIQLTVHDGKLMQLDITERRRFGN